MTGDETRPAVEALGISKAFGGVAALDAVDFEARWSEVHALVGENGAGKTTLCNILAGIYRADAGQVVVDGEVREFRNPAHAIEAGIGMVHQHFRLVEPMTVAENIHLGWSETPGLVSQRALIERTNRFMGEMGLHVDPTAKIWQLSVGEQQRVEILRVLARGARVLILDEPTAVLTAKEADDLFDVIRSLASSGLTVIFITHKLNEVLQVSDRLTVLRHGIREITRPTAGATASEIARLMTGEERVLKVEHRTVTGEPALELAGVSARNDRGIRALHDVDLTVRAGEILGIAGVSGNGQTELAEVVCALRDLESGSVTLEGTDIASMSVRAVTDMGVGHIPEDRIGMGMVLLRAGQGQRGAAQLLDRRDVPGLDAQAPGCDRLRQAPGRGGPGADPVGVHQRGAALRRQPAAPGGPARGAGCGLSAGGRPPHQRTRRERGPGGSVDDPRQTRRRPARCCSSPTTSTRCC